jgi:hypothetical protein
MDNKRVNNLLKKALFLAALANLDINYFEEKQKFEIERLKFFYPECYLDKEGIVYHEWVRRDKPLTDEELNKLI